MIKYISCVYLTAFQPQRRRFIRAALHIKRLPNVSMRVLLAHRGNFIACCITAASNLILRHIVRITQRHSAFPANGPLQGSVRIVFILCDRFSVILDLPQISAYIRLDRAVVCRGIQILIVFRRAVRIFHSNQCAGRCVVIAQKKLQDRHGLPCRCSADLRHLIVDQRIRLFVSKHIL